MIGQKPAAGCVQPVDIVHLLAGRPELRDVFPVADQVDMAVRAGA